MLRKDREITEIAEMIDILKRCDTLRIALFDEEYPYMVSVSFGIVEDGGMPVLYFHGAKKGHKAELIEKSPKICVEGDIFYKVEETRHGITARYESVLGCGTIEKTEGEEVVTGLRAICAHYGQAAYPVEECRNLPMTAVYKITLKSLTGKRNLPEKKEP